METTDFVINGARKYKLASEDLIELYQRLSIIIDDNQKKYGYECSGSGIGGDSIDFSIIVPRDSPLPEKLTNLFYCNIGVKYKVTCEKTPRIIEIFGKKVQLLKENEDRYTFEITKN